MIDVLKYVIVGGICDTAEWLSCRNNMRKAIYYAYPSLSIIIALLKVIT